MHGELAYKDRHGRVWLITADAFRQWIAETLDKGHTDEFVYAAYSLESVILAIDEEPYRVESKTLPNEAGTPGGFESGTGRQSEPESIEEIRRNASEIDRSEPKGNYPLFRPEEG